MPLNIRLKPKVFAHESLVELESVSMRRYGRSSIVHKNPVALAIGRFSGVTFVQELPKTASGKIQKKCICATNIGNHSEKWGDI
ncbi:hypothetical protein [Anoxybacillus kestanbolensis]|uniref:hypothetical protein n=1 Tax=Anoxybacillus kestanbolensis TaxID=227476 RepID=UPI003D1DE6B3